MQAWLFMALTTANQLDLLIPILPEVEEIGAKSSYPLNM